MFNKLFRIYNQNRRAIWTIIITIAFFILLHRTILGLIRDNREKQQQEALNNNYLNNFANSNVSNNVSTSNNLSNTNNSNSTQNIEDITSSSSPVDVINYFVNLCNSKKIEDAYNMLSKDCKSALFPTIDYFKSNYYNKVFTKERTAKIEKSMYSGDVYKVTYGGNLLANGGYNQGTSVQDYIYINKENENIKISLNRFLYISEINKTKEKDGISIRVVRKKVYVDYEEYQIQIINNTTEKIYITPNEEKVYLKDENNIQYTSNIDELQSVATLIEPGKVSTIQLKFNKMYSSSKRAELITFSEIITNYMDYINGNTANIVSININI